MGALDAILADAELEPAFIALTLTPPSEPDIAREIGRDVDPDAIFAARRHLRTATGRRLGPTLADTYSRMITPGPIGPTPPAPDGARSKTSASICWRRPTRARPFSARLSQYENADNMTDRMAALETLGTARPARARRGAGGFLRPLCRRSADHRQMARPAGGYPGAGNARSRARADRAPGLLHGQSQPRAFADRFVRASQPHPVQPTRRRRLPIRRRCRARARPEESAGGGPSDGRVPFLAGAGSRPARARTSGTPPRRRQRRRCRAMSATSSPACWPRADRRRPGSKTGWLRRFRLRATRFGGSSSRRASVNGSRLAMTEQRRAPQKVRDSL